MTALLAFGLWFVAGAKALDLLAGGAGAGWPQVAAASAEALAGAALLSTRWRSAALWAVSAAASGGAIGTLAALLETGGRSTCRCLGAVALPSAGALALQGAFLATCGLCLFRRGRASPAPLGGAP